MAFTLSRIVSSVSVVAVMYWRQFEGITHACDKIYKPNLNALQTERVPLIIQILQNNLLKGSFRMRADVLFNNSEFQKSQTVMSA